MSKQWLYIQDEAPEIATRVRYKILTAGGCNAAVHWAAEALQLQQHLHPGTNLCNAASTAALGGTIGAIATQR